jgi:tRNA nucleotidyltransferase/poly(A) polymerase
LSSPAEPAQATPESLLYAGRWVALVRGKVVAQGATQQEALLAARQSRRKDRLEIKYMPEMPVKSPLLDHVRALLPADLPVYLVGGAVRDAVLGRETHDLDFATPPGALKLARKLADKLPGDFFPLDEQNDTARIVLQNPDGSRDFLDFAGFRGDSLEADLRGRDFTINAVAMDLHTGHILDPLGGVSDIRAKRIRACAETALSDDPARILRAVRQAAAFGFSIDPETRKLMKAAVPLLGNISPERQRDELFKMLAGPKPDACIRALELLGVLPVLLPELPALKGVEQSAPHVHDVWTHTLAVLRHLEGILAALAPDYDESKGNADLFNGLLVLRLGRYRQQIGAHLGATLNPDRSARALLFFGALYHDVNKPQTRSTEPNGRIRFLGHDEQGALTAVKRGMALHLSNDELDRLKLLVRHHMRVHFHTNRKAEKATDPTRKAIYRFFRETGEAGVSLILLALADVRATYDHTLTQEYWTANLDVARILLEAYYEKAEQIIHPPQLLNGHDLINDLKMKPGPEIGKLLEAIRETQAGGALATREEALAFARGWLAHLSQETRQRT